MVSPGGPTSEGMLDLSGYARFFTCLFAAITALTILFLRQYARARGFAGDELYGLLLFAALGMVLVAGALNWGSSFSWAWSSSPWPCTSSSRYARAKRPPTRPA